MYSVTTLTLVLSILCVLEMFVYALSGVFGLFGEKNATAPHLIFFATFVVTFIFTAFSILIGM